MYNRIYLGGTFDCLHRGHLALFRSAHLYAHEVVVGLNTDAFAERYKRKPVMSYPDRYEVLLECRLVDLLVCNDGCEDSKPSILRSKADAIGHGNDWTGLDLMRQMGLTEEWLSDNRVTMVYMPYTKGVSTSDIIRQIAPRLKTP